MQPQTPTVYALVHAFLLDFEPTPCVVSNNLKGEVSVTKAVGAMHMDTRRGDASKLERKHTPSLGKIVVITLGVSDPHSVNRAAQSQVQVSSAGSLCDNKHH